MKASEDGALPRELAALLTVNGRTSVHARQLSSSQHFWLGELMDATYPLVVHWVGMDAWFCNQVSCTLPSQILRIGSRPQIVRPEGASCHAVAGFTSKITPGPITGSTAFHLTERLMLGI